MELIKVNFKDCSLAFLDDNLEVVQVDEHKLLTDWINLSKDYILDDIENIITNRLQATLIYRVHDWNEFELIEHFVGPLFSLINFNTKEYGMFSERLMKAVIGNYELSGCPDAVVAKGRRYPKIPYFCFHEYKKEQETKGDPQGQCLAAMMVAQELNNNERPLLGVVVKGEKWYFMVLQGKQYAISKPYKAVDEEIYEIVKLLKHLKTIIDEFVKN